MIYPTASGTMDPLIRLNTLESTMVQGRLKMWGRWSYIGGGRPGNIFNQLLSSRPGDRRSADAMLRQLREAGVGKAELASFLREMLEKRQSSPLAHCTDEEALIVDRVVGRVLGHQQALIELLHQRYDGRGRSKRALAQILHQRHPEWSFPTCRNRIDSWLAMAEAQLYAPLCEAFGLDADRLCGSGE